MLVLMLRRACKPWEKIGEKSFVLLSLEGLLGIQVPYFYLVRKVSKT